MAPRSDESIVFKPVSVCAWECLGVLCLCVHPWVPVSVCGPVSALVGASVRVCLCLHSWVPVCVWERRVFFIYSKQEVGRSTRLGVKGKIFPLWHKFLKLGQKEKSIWVHLGLLQTQSKRERTILFQDVTARNFKGSHFVVVSFFVTIYKVHHILGNQCMNETNGPTKQFQTKKWTRALCLFLF